MSDVDLTIILVVAFFVGLGLYGIWQGGHRQRRKRMEENQRLDEQSKHL